MLKGKTKDRYSVGLLPFRRRQGLACRRRLISELCTLRLEVADVPFLSRVERKVADRRHEPVDPQRDDAQKYIRKRARLEAFGLERRVVDDYAADPFYPCFFIKPPPSASPTPPPKGGGKVVAFTRRAAASPSRGE